MKVRAGRKEGWALKNWWFWIVVLEKILVCPLDIKEIKQVNPKGNQPWILIGRTGAEAVILWLPNTKSWLTGKDSDAGKDWGQEEKGATEDEMVGWHHWLSGHEFEQTPGAWCATVHGVAKSQIRLSNWTMNNSNRKQIVGENKEQREDFYFIEFLYRLGWKNQWVIRNMWQD